MKKHVLLTIVMGIGLYMLPTLDVQAQRHIYNRVELGGGNIWTFMGLTAVSTVINQVVHKPITESTLRFCVPVSEFGNLNGYQGFEDWNYDRFRDKDAKEYGNNGFIGFGSHELLSNLIFGDKIGYLSDRLGFVNYCVYGAGYYNLQQFKRMYTIDDYNPVITQRLQVGGGLMLIFGSIESSNRFIFDGGLRYNLPLGFSADGHEGSANDMLNKGISSHYMFKWSWGNGVAVGATLDLMHYDLFKDKDFVGSTSKTVEFGITVTALFN